MSDLHFSQGDGEITFCGAIEMAGWIDLEVNLIKDGMNKYNTVNPIFMPGPEEPRYT
jgi:formamidase